jgi:hypothetical protein
MQSQAETTEQYINELPDDRKLAITAIRDEIAKNIPKGFVECMNYGMIGFVVPHELYPAGYHCTPSSPFIIWGYMQVSFWIGLRVNLKKDQPKN